ncbi:hypothetical protein [Bradyrhizobium manausense]|nr:hypothetical protein [Bradyrhizobium manausense]
MTLLVFDLEWFAAVFRYHAFLTRCTSSPGNTWLSPEPANDD